MAGSPPVSDSSSAKDAELGALFERLRPQLFRRARSYVEIPDDAEDIVQQVLCDFWAGRHRVRSRELPAVCSYLLKMIRTYGGQFSAGSSRIRTVPIDHLADEFLVSQDATEENLQSLERERHVRCALNRLPRRTRELVREWQRGTPSADIGRLFGIPPATARKRVSRGIHWIRDWVVRHPDAADTSLYCLSSARISEIAARDARLSLESVREYCLAEWPEGDEHQDWLDTAAPREIAEWVVSLMEV